MQLKFTVDAALLRELGERLIGRPHIALAELIKNAYDADATVCRVVFKKDSIAVIDNGHGMSFDTFKQRWMRIGTTHKAAAATSAFGRRLTGSKGVGRLAVQYLADELTVESKAADRDTIVAVIDWTDSHAISDLTEVFVEVEKTTKIGEYPDGNSTGTRIVLTNVRNEWSAADIENLGREVWLLRSPFRRRGRSPLVPAEDFEVEFDSEDIPDAKAAFDAAMVDVFETWKARITGRLSDGRFGGSADLQVEFKAGYGAKEAESFRQKVKLPVPVDDAKVGPPLVDAASFEILVYKPEGRQPGRIPVGELREFLWRSGNVSIYDAGFRLPYYGADHDWLDLGRDQARRLDSSHLLPDSLNIDGRYMLDLPSTGRIFGVVEIDTAHERAVALTRPPIEGGALQIQVGRDRLLDNRAYLQLATLIRYALHYYANRHRSRLLRTAEGQVLSEPAAAKQRRALDTLDRNRSAMPAAVFSEVRKDVAEAMIASDRAEEVADRRVGLLAPLASAGMAALAMNHEFAREDHVLESAIRRLREAAVSHKLPDLAIIAEDLDRTRTRLYALQELFAPLLSETDKAATHRLKVGAVVEQTVSAMAVLMPGVGFETDVPADLLFPVGSLAEWNALLQNVLSNAWNAMLQNGGRRVLLYGSRTGRGRAALRISDDGCGLGMPPAEATVLFEPFERRLEIAADLRSMALGGQGLGLAIVRMIAGRRSVGIRFMEAAPTYATTFELSWKD